MIRKWNYLSATVIPQQIFSCPLLSHMVVSTMHICSCRWSLAGHRSQVYMYGGHISVLVRVVNFTATGVCGSIYVYYSGEDFWLCRMFERVRKGVEMQSLLDRTGTARQEGSGLLLTSRGTEWHHNTHWDLSCRWSCWWSLEEDIRCSGN